MKLVTIKFKMPEGGSRAVNRFMQKTIEHVSDELLVYDSATPFKFPLFNEGDAIGEVQIEDEEV